MSKAPTTYHHAPSGNFKPDPVEGARQSYHLAVWYAANTHSGAADRDRLWLLVDAASIAADMAKAAASDDRIRRSVAF